MKSASCLAENQASFSSARHTYATREALWPIPGSVGVVLVDEPDEVNPKGDRLRLEIELPECAYELKASLEHEGKRLVVQVDGAIEIAAVMRCLRRVLAQRARES